MHETCIYTRTREEIEVETETENAQTKTRGPAREDIDICERIQAGLESNGFDSGILSTKYEIGISHFQNYIESKINNG